MKIVDTDRPLAITDVELTGLDVARHEIIDVGLVLVQPQTLEVLDTFETKAKPLHLETADPESLKINGYNEEEWREAPHIEYALAGYLNRTVNAIFVSDNVLVDLGFIRAAVSNHQLWNRMHFCPLDLSSVAYGRLRGSNFKDFDSRSLAHRFGIPDEPKPHGALRGALRSFEIFKSIVTST